MRLHKNLVVAVIKVLDGVFNQNLYADKTIEKVLKLDLTPTQLLLTCDNPA